MTNKVAGPEKSADGADAQTEQFSSLLPGKQHGCARCPQEDTSFEKGTRWLIAVALWCRQTLAGRQLTELGAQSGTSAVADRIKH